MITITAPLLDRLKTPAGGFNQRSMEIIGNWPLHSGWKERLIGTAVADRKWTAAVRAASEGARHRFRGNTRGRR